MNDTEKSFGDTGKRYSFVNFSEDDELLKTWDINLRLLWEKPVFRKWFSYLGNAKCKFENVFVVDPFYGLYDVNEEEYKRKFENSGIQKIVVGGGQIMPAFWDVVTYSILNQYRCRNTSPILGMQCKQILLIDKEKLYEIYEAFGTAAVYDTIMHESTHMLEDFLTDSSSFYDSICDITLRDAFFNALLLQNRKNEILSRCPDLREEGRQYLDKAAKYQLEKDYEFECMTTVVGLFTAAVLDADAQGMTGLHGAVPILEEMLENALNIALPVLGL